MKERRLHVNRLCRIKCSQTTRKPLFSHRSLGEREGRPAGRPAAWTKSGPDGNCCPGARSPEPRGCFAERSVSKIQPLRSGPQSEEQAVSTWGCSSRGRESHGDTGMDSNAGKEAGGPLARFEGWRQGVPQTGEAGAASQAGRGPRLGRWPRPGLRRWCTNRSPEGAPTQRFQPGKPGAGPRHLHLYQQPGDGPLRRVFYHKGLKGTDRV